ncbi:MAG: Polyribonucleotide nucleotidyltransferase [Candidatus Magasanikbacteria bacterium GW2011_GWC2_37_14]|uniref:Polyribonucleotide nucleotidyltransferase n=1 Tax=Candidatus Magasanikbacteria bacterium GW2011_GWC2_37_14 TaxID=1619046 RepID=A0A0G0JHG6_9BACT|nr:MAG: Polyribonucleotide nucleotidyltransferase [Candidatus Magasanikbacteria bacterium GW2011_GWC2_37_14]
MENKSWSLNWGGRELTVEVGKLALLTNGSCTVRYGDTVVLATVVKSKKEKDADYFPLSVEFEEKLYAAGKIKGSRFIKKEGRPSDAAILSGRLIDRAIRPLFDDRVRNEVQVVVTPLSVDQENDAAITAFIAASVVVSISNIPWNGPVAAARIGRVNGELILNVTGSQLESAENDLNLVVAGTPEKLIMVEAGAKEVSEKDMLEAMQWGLKQLQPVIEFINKIKKEIGLPKDVTPEKIASVEEAGDDIKEKVKQLVRKFVLDNSEKMVFDKAKISRTERIEMLNNLETSAKEFLVAQGVVEEDMLSGLQNIKLYVEEVITKKILDKEQRLDGRKLDEVRALSTEVDLLPRVHGSALFQRGDTQVLSIVTLGAPGDKQTLDGMEEDGTKRYMHHYNDAPYTYGETGRVGGPGRRAIGHGALAERALEPVLPAETDFPYTIRVVSEVLGSNGSSSMASTCGSTMSLMAAGVPIKKPVVGVAMGLASESDENGKIKRFKVLTDLQDVEDGPGGMDFKITGTADGITAMQMDTKTTGLTWEIVEKTIKQNKEAREVIMKKVVEAIATPRAELSPYAPRIETIQINPEKIGDLIGPGGKTIKKITEETGVSIDIEQDGRVLITSVDAEAMKKAIQYVKDLTHEVTAGETYDGTVVRLEDFGAFINILPSQDGLVHVSEISWNRVGKPSDVLKIGDKVKVLVKEIDNLGRTNLSIKALIAKPEGYVAPAPFVRDNGGQKRGGFVKRDH